MQPRDWRRSAAPEEDVEARLPCYGWCPSEHFPRGMQRRGYLDDPSACACSNHCGCRAHVERVVPISARSDDIDDEILVSILDFCLECTSSQNFCGGSQRIWSSFDPVDVQGRQESADLNWMDGVWGEEEAQRRLEIGRREILRLFDEFAQESLERSHGICKRRKY